MSVHTDSAARPWHTAYDAQVPSTIAIRELPLFAYLDEAAAAYPKRAAVTFRNYTLSYAQLHRLAEVMAANLRRQGLRPGDRIAIMLPNLPQTVISFWAALKAGATVVMINPLYMETELLHQLTDSGARHMILLDMLWPKIHTLRSRLPVERYFVTRLSDALAFPLNILYAFKARREGTTPSVPYDDVSVQRFAPLLRGTDRLPGHVANPAEILAVLQYTGGTTGVSKGVMLTHANLAANVQQMRTMLYALDPSKGLRFLGLLPFFHVYGLSVCLAFPTAIAATVLVFPRYVPMDVLKAIHKHRPSVFPGAPAIYSSLMDQKVLKKYNLRSIRYCISGSAPLPLEVKRRFEELTGAVIIEGYGLTEASPVTHLNPLEGRQKPGTIGLPFPNTDARIVDMELGVVPLPPGKAGELVIKGPQVMRGYWNRPDETASALRNGWLYTGDIAIMDEEGYFSIVDRKKDMILVAGYNVYPREIDEVLLEHPLIKEAVAVGVPHPSRGETIKTYVVPVPGAALSRSEIIAHCRSRLASYKIPKLVEFREELPKTMVGKVLRRALQAEEEEKARQHTAAPNGNGD